MLVFALLRGQSSEFRVCRRVICRVHIALVCYALYSYGYRKHGEIIHQVVITAVLQTPNQYLHSHEDRTMEFIPIYSLLVGLPMADPGVGEVVVS